MQQLTRTIVRNSMVGFVAQLAIKLLSFGFNILIVRSLGASDYGQYTAVLSFGAVFLFIADLGLAPYTVREVARLRDAPDGEVQVRVLYSNVLALRLLLGLLSGILVVITALATGRPMLMVVGVALNALNVLLYAVQGSSEAILSGYERLDLNSGVKVVNQLVFILLGGVALWMGIGYFGLIIATMAGFVVMTIVCWRAVRRLAIQPGRPAPAAWWPLLRAAFPFGVIGLTLGLSYRFDSVLLNIAWGDETTGHYNAVYNLIFSLATISNVLNTALYPSLARQAIRAPETLPHIYERTLRYLLLISVPIAVGGILLARPLVAWLFGTEYAPSAPLLQILIIALPLMFCSEFLGYVVIIAGREAKVARAVIVSTSVNVIANLALIPLYGPFAAATITLVTEVVLVAQYLWLLRDLLGQMNWRSLLLPLVASAAMAAVVLFVANLPLLLTIMIGAVVYGMLLLALRVVGRDEANFVRTMLKRHSHVASDPVS